MPATYLDRLLDYNNWANQGLLEFLGTLPAETLDATAPGVYGTIRETLEHLLSSELSYERRFMAPQPAPAERPRNPDLATLQAIADKSVRRLAGLIDSLPEPGTMIQLDDGMRAAATILTQLLMHSCEHRTHIGTVIGALGIELPDLDGWAHGIFAHGDDWPADWGPEPVPRGRYPGPGQS